MIFIKKYFLLLIIGVLIIAAGFNSKSLLYADSNHFNVYVKNQNDCFGYFDVLKADAKTYRQLKKENKIIGECVEIDRDELGFFLSKFGVNITNEYAVSGRKVLEGVSKVLPYKIANQNFNVQISIYDNIAKIASPALLDSF